MAVLPFNRDDRPAAPVPSWAERFRTNLEIADLVSFRAEEVGVRILDAVVSPVRVRVVVEEYSRDLARKVLGRDVVPYEAAADVWHYRGAVDGIRVEIVGPVSAR